MKKRHDDRYRYAEAVYEHHYDETGSNDWENGAPSKPVTVWRLVPRICGNCPLAYESTKCKRTSCRVKSLERRGIPAVY
jgi:hypothetical protein